MKQVLVIQDNSDDVIIGVASNVGSATRMISEYFGEKSEIRDVRKVEESGIEFTCTVLVKEDDGYTYPITVFYFDIDENY